MLAARRELGPTCGDQLAAYRTAELRHAAERERAGSSLERAAQTHRFVSALVSLGAGIPITAIAATHGGLAETAVCWAGIVGVNVAQAFGARRR